MHEWNDPALVAALGSLRKRGGRFHPAFHDTHHRAVSDPAAIRAFDLSGYDGVLAFGETLADVYRRWGWGDRVWTWHEAADTRLFHPPGAAKASGRDSSGSAIGATASARAELRIFSCARARRRPAARHLWRPLSRRGAGDADPAAGAHYRGWLPNARVPELFARHSPRSMCRVGFIRRRCRAFRPFASSRRSPAASLVSSPWDDAEHLFRPGRDYLVAHDGAAMTRASARAAARSGLRHGSRPRAWRPSAPAIPARIASTSCLASSPSLDARRAVEGTWRENRLLRIEPLSSYWNGAATYYRGILRDLAQTRLRHHLL